MTEELTEEEKQAENDRLEILEAQQEKNRRRGPVKKAVRKKKALKSSINGDMITCITLKKIARPGSDTEMCDIGEEVSITRENAIKLQDAMAVKVKL